VIVGAGPAGVAAAVQCQRLGVSPRLIDRTGTAGGLIVNGYLVENYPGLEEPLPGPAFGARLGNHLARFGVSVEQGELRGVGAAAEGWRLDVDGDELLTETLILATGTAPRNLALGPDPVVGARLFYEVRELLGAVARPRRVLVVGGGEAAFDYGLTLARVGARVEIAIRGPAPRARGRLLELAAEASIRVRPGTSLVALEAGDGGVAARLATAGGEASERVDAVLAAVGRRSTAPELLGEVLGGDDARSLTPKPGLFICGDGRSGSLGQAGIAVGDGLVAAALAVQRAVGG